jgi:hypothetical protein
MEYLSTTYMMKYLSTTYMIEEISNAVVCICVQIKDTSATPETT